MKLKLLLATFILSLPFWWAMNALAGETENFLYWYRVSKDPYVLSANLKQATLEREVEKARERNRPDAEEVNIGARSALSVVIENGKQKILFEKDSQKKYPIASLTKLITALVVFDLKDAYNLNDKVMISQEAVNQEGESKFMPLAAGEEFSVKNLLHIALLESSNDAAYALSQAVGIDRFVELMNEKAQEIGLDNTFFANPTGLDPDDIKAPTNYSTARDIAKLARYILENEPVIFEITSLRSWEVVDEKDRVRYFIPENTNKLIDEFSGIIGGKTGWTPWAKGCLLVLLKDSDNRYYINVVMGSDNRFGEMKEIIQKINGF